MTVVAIDPGPAQSALVVWDGRRVGEAWQGENAAILSWLRERRSRIVAVLAIERVRYMTGMPAGESVFETTFWSGRYAQAWQEAGLPIVRMTFPEIKLALCGTHRANEAHVRRALLDRIGEPGTKRAPGTTYGVKGHCWSALALAYLVAGGR